MFIINAGNYYIQCFISYKIQKRKNTGSNYKKWEINKATMSGAAARTGSFE